MSSVDEAQDDEDFVFYHLDEHGHLTWTEDGLQAYTKRFARFGMAIQHITTFDEYKTAIHISAAGFTDSQLERIKDKPPTLEWRALRAVLENSEEYPELLEKLKKRNRLGLRVVD